MKHFHRILLSRVGKLFTSSADSNLWSLGDLASSMERCGWRLDHVNSYLYTWNMYLNHVWYVIKFFSHMYELREEKSICKRHCCISTNFNCWQYLCYQCCVHILNTLFLFIILIIYSWNYCSSVIHRCNCEDPFWC